MALSLEYGAIQSYFYVLEMEMHALYVLPQALNWKTQSGQGVKLYNSYNAIYSCLTCCDQVTHQCINKKYIHDQ